MNPEVLTDLGFVEMQMLRIGVASLMVMLCTLTIFFLMRSCSAALRHRVLLLGTGGCIVLLAWIPITHRFSPTLHLARTQPAEHRQAVLEDMPDREVHPGAESYGNTLVASMLEHESYQQVDSAVADSEQPMRVDADESREPASAGAVVSFVTTSSKNIVDNWFSLSAAGLPGVLIRIWALGTILFAARIVVERLRLARLLAKSISVTDSRSIRVMKAVSQSVGMPSVRMLCSDAVHVPIAVGVLRPAIVLPTGYGKWADERLRVVLMHELAHLSRQDVFAQFVARCACALYWFNPLVWWVAGRMCIERELACDDSVLRSGEEPAEYACHLVGIASQVRHRWNAPNAAIAMAAPSNLRKRVRRMMLRDVDRSVISRSTSGALVAVATVVSALLAMAAPSFALQPDDTDPQANVADDDTTPGKVMLSGDLPADWFQRLSGRPILRDLTIRSPGKNFKAERLAELTQLEAFQAEDFELASRTADDTLAAIAQLPNLRSVTFARTGLTDAGTAPLSVTSVDKLSLIGEELLTDAAYGNLKGMKSLEKLELISTPIEVTGLKHLKHCPQLRSFSLLKDLGATKRIPVIAQFDKLEELELDGTAYSELTALKDLQSLRQLTLRRCGAFKATESLSQLQQLERLRLDNADLRTETFEQLQSTLAELGIEVSDISQKSAELADLNRGVPDEATLLARKVHRELDVAQHHPTFWVRWGGDWGKIASMRQERIRTVHRLKQAIDAESKPLETAFEDQDTITAWAPGEFFTMNKYFKDGKIASETYKYGGAELAWAREKYGPESPVKHFPRNGVKEFSESFFYLPANLRISHQSYWWGVGKHHRVATSSIPPELATYVELPSEPFAGEVCRVLESAARTERLWVSRESGLLRGVLTFMYQGFSTPFHHQPIVKEIAGREIKTRDEYRALFDDPSALSDRQREQLAVAWTEYKFDHAIPGRLYRFSDYRQIAPQRWYAFQVDWSGWHHNDKNERYYSFHNGTATVKEVRLNEVDLESAWEPLLPKEGEQIQDQRFAVPVDYEYRPGRSQEEIDELVHEQLFKYASSQIEFAKRSDPYNKLIGQTAFDLPVKRWIGERPELTGKSYLLHFWATWCGPCKNDVPILNAIAKNRLVIGIHPGDTPLKQIRKSAKEAGMNYPTVVADPKSKDLLGYKAQIFPYVVEVDEQGTVTGHGTLRSVLELDASVAMTHVSTLLEPAVTGNVLAVQPTGAMVVLSIGKNDGVREGQLVDVVNDQSVTAQLRIVLVRENRCVGKVTPPRDFENLSIGDSVRLSE